MTLLERQLIVASPHRDPILSGRCRASNVNLRGAPPDQLEFLERIGVTSAGTSNGAAEPAAIVNDDASPLHERVKAARLARGWSQRELAEAAGTHQPIVSKLENGRPVDDALLARILAVLGERPFLNL